MNDYDRARRARRLVEEIDDQDARHAQLREKALALLEELEDETADHTHYQ